MPTITTQSPANSATGRSWFFWFVLLAGAVALFLFAANVVVGYRYGGLDKYGYAVENQGDGVYVQGVDAGGPAVGKLEAGDRIVALTDADGTVPIRWSRDMGFRLHRAPAGSAYALSVERRGAGVTVELQLAIYPTPRANDRWIEMLGAMLSALPFALMALLIGARKPQDSDARRAFVAMMGFALNYLYSGVISNLPHLFDGFWTGVWFAHLALSGVSLFIACAYNLYYRFPAGMPRGRVWSALKWLLFAAGGFIYVCGLTRVGLLATEQTITAGMLEFFTRLRQFHDAYIVTGLLAICAVCLRNYRLVAEPGQRNRLRLIVYGSFAAFLPNIGFYLLRFVVSVAGLDRTQLSGVFRTLDIVSDHAPTLVAAAWGYAILKHRVLEVNLVVRRGIQYLLAKNVLRVILALPLIGLLWGIIANPNRTLKEMIFAQPLNLALIALLALSLKLRRQLRTWVDRRFFSEAYDQEQVLLRLIDQIKEFSSIEELSRMVSQQVSAALHPERAFIYYREAAKSNLTVGYVTGASAPSQLLPVDARLLRELEGRREPCEYPSALLAGLPFHERVWIEELGVSLIVPLSGTNDRLLGLMLLGEKKSEQPYTRQDRALLQAIARQMAVVFENIRLKQQVDKELKIKHQVLAHLDEKRINLVRECPVCGACYDGEINYCLEDGHKLDLTLPVERIVDGKYRLERLIGKGGMGAVYVATDLRLGRQVAVKILTGSLFGNRDALQRFEREARASARLNHPNIVAIHDYGRAGAEGAYLVMEFLSGASMRAEIDRLGALSPVVAADWFDQMLEGVKVAHAAGVIHRDLKPENVLIVAQGQGRGQVKILDFGLSKLKEFDLTAASTLTVPGMLIGTPGYMAPEHLAGEETDERGDIFALGVMTVEALTGRRPFSGRSHGELLAAVSWRPYSLPGNGPEVARLNDVLRKCLALEPEQRFATIAELQRELIPALRACPPMPSRTQAEPGTETNYRPDVSTVRPDAITKVD